MAKPCGSLAQQLLICCFALLPVSAHPVAAAPSPSPSPSPAPAPAPAVKHEWNVQYIMWAPDCNQRVMIGINGQFPGPNITVNAGDWISVKVTNHLHTEGVVIHWHGIKQIGTPWADGTASISQCPINPGETFTYEFLADKPGTFFYHGHFGMQRAAGLYGSLIVKAVEEEPFEYDGEHSMLLSDWWHENVFAQAAGLDGTGKHWQWVGEPQTLLINGRGQFGCSLASGHGACDRHKKDGTFCPEDKSDEVCELMIQRSECGPFCKDSQCSPVVFDVDAGKTYRLRIASTTSIATLNVKVEGHKLRVLEADGNFVEPFNVDDIDIYSGESYSVLLIKDDPTTTQSSFWISVSVIVRQCETPPALAILNYKPGADSWPPNPPPETTNVSAHRKQVAPAHRVENWAGKITAWRPTGSSSVPPELQRASDRQITLLNTQDRFPDGRIKWAINHVSLALPATPYIGAFFYDDLMRARVFDDSAEPPDTYDGSYDITKSSDAQAPAARRPATVSDRVFRIKDGDVVDVVLQNANMLQKGVSEPHPWHLHGHDFWVLGYGEGRYTGGDDDKRRLNMVDPPLRNTVVLFPDGWTAIRFVADNPGVWAFHCHIEPHLHMGMGVIFAEGTDKLRGVPRDAVMCGKAKTVPLPLTPATAMPPSPAP